MFDILCFHFALYKKNSLINTENYVNFEAWKNFSLLNQMYQKDVKVADHPR